MRKFLILLLAASAMTPAVAHAEEGGFGRGIRAHAERSQSAKSSDKDSRPQREERSADRPQRAERSVDRPQRVERAERSVDRPQRIERVRQVETSVDRDDGPVRIERRERPVRIRREIQPVQVAEPGQPAQQVEPVRRVQRTRGGGDSMLDGFRAVAQDARDGRSGDRDGDRDRDRWRDRDRDGDRWRDRDRDRHRWSGDWRRDRRYDWHNHRSRYGSLFRLGRYYDPYGWGYRRFSIGFSLWPNYYRSSRYWLNDPWQYRLPYAPPGYRWIRYYDDALLVDTWDGRVVDVIHNFFW